MCACVETSPPSVQVARHLAKLFDSMARLKFKEESDGKPSKEAVGMYSKDGEYVDFAEPCMCVGQVSLLNISIKFFYPCEYVALYIHVMFDAF